MLGTEQLSSRILGLAPAFNNSSIHPIYCLSIATLRQRVSTFPLVFLISFLASFSDSNARSSSSLQARINVQALRCSTNSFIELRKPAMMTLCIEAECP
ncbi:hypothetical protein GDO78_017507 [Eleutherodactylus coqui]|uniref:Uncharacterized protein n=1 Tax=Eleutherodactylus coqui TaxID=57060 RepID=A0A8J6EBU1_ELECQ|nr:hypothetical protein GDO78_017507 [Eleutherodactylus coqui]